MSFLRDYYGLDDDDKKRRTTDVSPSRTVTGSRVTSSSDSYLRNYFKLDKKKEAEKKEDLTPSQRAAQRIKEREVEREPAQPVEKGPSLFDIAKRGLVSTAGAIKKFFFGEDKLISPVPEIEVARAGGDEERVEALSSVYELLRQGEDRLQTAKNEFDLRIKSKAEPGTAESLREGARNIFFTGVAGLDKEETEQLDAISFIKDTNTLYRQFLGMEENNKGLISEVFSKIKKKPLETIVPFFSSKRNLVKYTSASKAIDKLNSGEELTTVEKASLENVKAQVLTQAIDTGLGEKVGGMLVDMIPYAMLYGMSNPTAVAVEKKVLTQLASKKISEKTASKITKSVIAKSVGAAVQTSTVFAPKVAEGTAEYMLPDYELIAGKKGDELIQATGSGDDFRKALTKSWLVNYIEVGSEKLGDFIEPLSSKLMPKAIIGKFADLTGITEPTVLKKMLKDIGWNGVIAEVFEEEIAELLQAPVEERKYYAPFLTPEGTERLLVETLGIGVFAGVAGATNIALNTLDKSGKPKLTPIDLNVDPEITDEIRELAVPGIAEVIEPGVVEEEVITAEDAEIIPTEAEVSPPPPTEEVAPEVKEVKEVRPAERVEEAKPKKEIKITKELEPLAKEARKFKTADEFVDSFRQKASSLWDDLSTKLDATGKSFPTEESIAKEFPGEWNNLQGALKLEKLNIDVFSKATGAEMLGVRPDFPNQSEREQLADFYNQATLKPLVPKEAPVGAITVASTDNLVKIVDRGGFRTPEQIAKLKADIIENGIRFPIELIEKADGTFEVNDGTKRIKIAKDLGITKLEVKVVKKETKAEAAEKAEFKRKQAEAREVKKKPTKPKKPAPKKPAVKKKPPLPVVPKKSFTPKSTVQPKLVPLKKQQRKAIQTKTKEVVFSGDTQEQAVRNVDKYMKDVLNQADSPTYVKALKVVRAELKRSMYEVVGATTGHWKRDYAFFQNIRRSPEVSDLVDEVENGIFEIDEIINPSAPPMMGGSLASTASETIDTFEDRPKPKKGTSEFKLFEKTQELIRKYAQSIGEGYLPRKALGVYYQPTKNIRVNALNNLSTVAHEVTHFLDAQYKISDRLLAVKGFSDGGIPIYDSNTMKLRRQITDVYTKYYPGGKKTHTLRKRATEGFATLLQKYVETPTKIEKEFPLLVDTFFKKGGQYYEPIMAEIITDLNKIVAGYQGLSSLDKIGSRVTSEDANIDKDSFLSFFDRVRTQLVDELYPIEVLAKKSDRSFSVQDPTLWLRAFNSVSGIINNNIASKRGYWSLRGNTFKKLHDFNWKTLSDLTQERKNTDDFGFYLVARREHFAYRELDTLKGELENAKRVAKEVAKIDSKKYKTDAKYKQKFRDIISELDDFGIDSDTKIDVVKASMKKAFKRAELKHKEFKGILDRDGFSRAEVDQAYEENKSRFVEEERMFDILTQADLDFMSSENVQLITPAQRNQLKSKQGYASFKRQFYDEILGDRDDFPNTARIGGVRASSFLKRKGSQKTIINPLYSGIANHSEMMRKGLKQVVYNKMVDIGNSAAFPNLFQQQQLKVIPDPNTGALIYPQEKDRNIIMGRQDYKRRPVLVDKQVKTVLDNILTYENIDVFQRLYVGLSRMFTAGTTGFYPQFAATNFVVDQITAMANTTNKYRPIYSALVEFKNILKDKTGNDYRYYEEYLVLGGERQTFTGWQKLPPNKLFEAIKGERKGLQKAINLMEKGTDVLSTPSKYSELVTRITEYVKARKNGKAQIVALEEAGRVTAPFHHIGSWGGKGGQTFIRGLPFFNATLQVLDQTVRTLETTGGRKRTAAVMTMTTAAYLVAITQLLRASDEQKEQYKDLEPKELAGFLYFPHPSGRKLIRVKMSQTFSGLGTMLNMIIADQVLGTNYSTREYATAATAWLPDQFNPLDPVQAFLSWIPHIFSVGTETIFNVKTYPRVSPLESMGLQNLPPEMRTNENTSTFAKWLGEKAELSPIKIDYFLTGYFGRAIGFATGKPSAYKFGSSVIRDYYFSGGRRVSGAYDLKEENDQNYTAYQRGAKELTREEVDELYRVKILTTDFGDIMKDYRKVSIEKEPDLASEIRSEAIQVINQIDNGDFPEGFEKWAVKAEGRRDDKIGELEEQGLFPDGEKLSNDTFIDSVVLYAKAIGVDPVTAFNRIVTGQKIRKLTNKTIIVERLDLKESQAIKEKEGAKNPEMKLDHTIPLELGGSNSKSNLKIVTTEEWKTYTSVENALGRALKKKKITKKEAQSLILDFKNGKIDKDDVLEQIR